MRIRRLFHTDLARGFWRDTRGASAIEFAIGAAVILVPSLLWMSELGLGFVSRIELERHVRSGSEAVMLGETDPDNIRKLVDAVAASTPGIRDTEVVLLCDGNEPEDGSDCDDNETKHFMIVLPRERERMFNLGGPQLLEARASVRIP